MSILNVGAGDLRLSFDKANPAERERAKTVVQDMLKRGYAILVQVGEQNSEPLYQRAHGFDPETCEYLIFGAPEDARPEEVEPTPEPRVDPDTHGTMPRHVKGRAPKRVKAETARTVGVARSAGG